MATTNPTRPALLLAAPPRLNPQPDPRRRTHAACPRTTSTRRSRRRRSLSSTMVRRIHIRQITHVTQPMGTQLRTHAHSLKIRMRRARSPRVPPIPNIRIDRRHTPRIKPAAGPASPGTANRSNALVDAMRRQRRRIMWIVNARPAFTRRLVVLVVDEDLGDGKVRDLRHAGCANPLHLAAEGAGPVEGVEEADDDVAADGLFDSLEAGAATEEFF
jgi:hypothetical protein